MIRKLQELLISRSIDDGKPLPKWLAQRVQKDRSLRQFHEQMYDLHQSLQREAAKERQATPDDSIEVKLPVLLNCSTKGGTARRSWARSAQVAGAVAATLLVMALVNRSHQRGAQAAQIQMLGQQLAAVPPEMLHWLNSTVEASQTQLARYRPTVHLPISSVAFQKPFAPQWTSIINRGPSLDELDWQRMWQEMLRKKPSALQ